MDEPITERLRRGYDVMNTGDFEDVLELLDPQIEIRDRETSPDASVYHGHEGARDAFRVSSDMFERFQMVPLDIQQVNDEYVVVRVEMRGAGKASGVPVTDEFAHLWQIENDRAVGLRVFDTLEEAVRAAVGARPGAGEAERSQQTPDL